jgi:3-dehydroquinate dehydratase II
MTGLPAAGLPEPGRREADRPGPGLADPGLPAAELTETGLTEALAEAEMIANEVTVLVLNGPNLGRLGSREPEIYGRATLADVAAACAATGEQLGLAVDVRQTDDEAELVGWVHQAADERLPVVLNPAAFTHYSYALHDALAMRTAPLVEVHLSNPATRETFRHTSVVASVADGTVAGFGLHSYELALRAVAALLAQPPPAAAR